MIKKNYNINNNLKITFTIEKKTRYLKLKMTNVKMNEKPLSKAVWRKSYIKAHLCVSNQGDGVSCVHFDTVVCQRVFLWALL